MKIGCAMLSWNNPEEVGRAIRCFELQDYPDRELLCLDDGGSFPDQPEGDRWRAVSFKRRFRTIGEKRNACIGLMSPDVDAIQVFDSDDLLLPWALSSVATALENATWGQARIILEWDNDGAGPGWHKQESFSRSNPFRCAYHSGWSMLRSAYEHVGGYPPAGDEDWPLADKLFRAFGPSADSTADGCPWMAYSRGPSHLSSRYVAHGGGPDCFAKAWEEKGQEVVEPVDLYPLIKWDRPYDQIEIPPTVWPRPW